MNKSQFAGVWFFSSIAACGGDIHGTTDDDAVAVADPKGVTGAGNVKAIPDEPALVSDVGILDCPTVDYPGTTSATVKLSAKFQRNCGTCHGGSGEGTGPYPALPGKLSKAEFIATVRAGTNNMPSFSPTLMEDRALDQENALLARKQPPHGRHELSPPHVPSAVPHGRHDGQACLTAGTGQGEWIASLEAAAKTSGSDAALLANTAQLAREVLELLTRAPAKPAPEGYNFGQ